MIKSYLTILALLFFKSEPLKCSDNRDWIVGKYIGKRVTVTSITTSTCNSAVLNVIKDTNNGLAYLDSVCPNSWTFRSSSSVYVDNDSTIKLVSNNAIKGKLYFNDSLHLSDQIYIVSSGTTYYYYDMHKLSSYTGNLEYFLDVYDIIFYPNPVNSRLRLMKRGNIEVGKIALYYLDGKNVILNMGQNYEVDVKDIPDGLYFLKIETPVGILTKKIIIQH